MESTFVMTFLDEENILSFADQLEQQILVYLGALL